MYFLFLSIFALSLTMNLLPTMQCLQSGVKKVFIMIDDVYAETENSLEVGYKIIHEENN